jgi:cytochrome c-type biogenesis protein CcmH
VTAFWVVVAVLCLVAVAILVLPLWRQRQRSGRWSALGLGAALAIVPVAVGLYSQISSWDPDAAEQASEGARLVAALAERLRETPDDVEGWRLLARSYMALGQYEQARNAYRETWLRTPAPDNELKLSFAEALILTDRATLGGDAGRLVEDVLAAEPRNPKALWYGGLVALEVGRQDDVRARWSRLLELNPPDELRAVLSTQLAALAGPAAGAGAPGRGASGGAAGGPSLRLSVRLGEGRSLGELGPAAQLFIFARAPGGGPPLAVIREPATALPGEFTLSDANSMIPGRSLADFEELNLVARLSRTGQPTEQAGDWYAQAVVRPTDGAAVELVIDQVVQ